VKVVRIQDANLETCVQEAQRSGVILTHNGKPVAVVVGVKGLDWEQLILGYSDKFWTLMRERQSQRTISRAALNKRLSRS
jgi:prevent-host-death family protein